MTNKSLVAGIILMEVSGLSMAIASLIPGGSQWAAGLVLPGPPALETTAARLGIGIGGALMVGWGVTLWLLLRSAQRSQDHSRQARLQQLGRAIFAGTSAWFVVDSAISVALGASFNVVFNLLYLAALGGPAWGLIHAQSPDEESSGP